MDLLVQYRQRDRDKWIEGGEWCREEKGLKAGENTGDRRVRKQER